MPIADKDIIHINPAPISGTESMFLPEVFKGLGTTIKHMFNSLGGGSNMKTVQYPEQRREDMPVEEGGLYRGYYRGVHRLNRDEQGRVRCVACMMCPTVCPANCIHVEAAEAPWDDREKYPAKFDIDELRCIYCGMCEEVCPVDAIELTPTYDLVGLSRQEMIFDKQKLLAVHDATIEDKPM
jgi:NADH-quinone oxidoreductase subunit I